MATFNYTELKNKYDNFAYPFSVVEINNKDISKDKNGLVVSDLMIELTSGFEASLANFSIYNCYDNDSSQFEIDKVKKYIMLGALVKIYVGYGKSCREVFRGFISQIRFFSGKYNVPGIEVTAMDVKGIMMANNNSCQLKSEYFSDAVREIFQKKAYTGLQTSDIISRLDISATPDKVSLGGTSQQSKASDKTIEMVCESDYEFVVKAAKKFNYEFFSIGGTVYFRKAKENSDILLEAAPNTGLRGYEITYDITGQTESIEVRSMDAGKAQVITTQARLNPKLTQGGKAKALLRESKKSYIDPTVSSRKEAQYRLDYLKEEMMFRLGSLEAEFLGLPELIPGRFIKMKEMGDMVSNTFYIVSVTHTLDTETGFTTKIKGKASGMGNII
ncbi:MAG: phage late control D family protein [Lachnospiraceae bacterium]|nr:phage late control D family protein [Lachnospiraceae bacterium]